MKYLYCLTLIGLSLVSFLSCGEDSNTANVKPKITFKQDTITFPMIAVGDSIKVSFAFENTGDAPLQIFNVGTSCGCTIADYNKNEIPPGEKGNVSITYSNTNDTTDIFRTIVVKTNTEKKLNVVYLKGIK